MEALSGQGLSARRGTVAAAAAALIFSLTPATYAQTPKIAPAFEGRLLLETASLGEGRPTQFAWGPEGRLFVATNGQGVFSYRYDRLTGKLTDRKLAVREAKGGIGIAFHRNGQGIVAMYLTVNDDGPQEGAILKLDDKNKNGVWGETNEGELRVRIVQRIPIGDHAVDQLIVRGDTLFVGIGRRTIAGRRGPWTMGSHSDDPADKGFWAGGTGFSWGDSAYNGIIGWIQNLNEVVNETDSANVYGPNAVHDEAFYTQNNAPYAIILNQEPTAGKLLIHSAGTRNPFGLALDREGGLWFTNNFNRTTTSGNGEANDSAHGDTPQPDFDKAVHDQVFRARPGADYGYHDDNWRGKPTSFMMPSDLTHVGRVYSTTFDNLFNNGPYPNYTAASDRGLGPNASANGCSFFYAGGLPKPLENNLFIARFNGPVTDGQGKTLSYRDVVSVDPNLGIVRRIAVDFDSPICLLWDGAQRLLVGDYGTGKIYTIRPALRRLSVRATVTRPTPNGEVIVEMRLSNTGDLPLTDISLTGVTLRDSKSRQSFPISVANIAPGGVSGTVRLVFPRTVPTGNALLNVQGRYNDTNFSSALRVAVP